MLGEKLGDSEKLGDRRLSQLLNSMRQLLRSSDVGSNGKLFRELFLQCLPQSTRLVLAAAGELTLDRLAQLADRVTTLSSTLESSMFSRLESRIDQPAASIDVLWTSSLNKHGVSTRKGHRASSPSAPPHAVLEVHLSAGIIALTSTAPADAGHRAVGREMHHETGGGM
ncbi:hypothetical protein HPB50_004769 [Hyalomma asiaticum]|uniref:Uncharacterized protein n=1 Tax=Hyalomma asiaticum TaxID=266040 RepID=A0ACB7RQF3_HYAAI|nr:hypothetical protein HPB50_004769 [Hyalomma asiaticum]